MATITINGSEYFTFATVEQADHYFNAKFGSTWGDISNDDKAKLLVSATREINNLEFKGIPLNVGQPLAFPRVICDCVINPINPEEDLITCCAEIANTFYNLGASAETVATPNAQNIKSMSVGDTSITYKDGATIDADVFSATAKPLVKKYLGKWLKGNIRVLL